MSLLRQPPSDYLPTLDGWRALAILGVIISHSNRTFATYGITAEQMRMISGITRLGVDLFFAISGFLICTKLLRELERSGTISLTDFYTRRVFRILPPYYFFLVVLFFLSQFAGLPIAPGELVSSLLFVRNYVLPESGVTGHFWSLSVEEHFYLMWPPLLVVLRPRWTMAVTIGLVFVVFIWRALEIRYQILPPLLSARAELFRTDTRLDGILCGCVGALLWQRFPALAFPSWASWLIIPTIVIVTLFPVPGRFLILSILFATLVMSTVLCQNSWLSWFLEQGWLRWIGRLSYSLYIWQGLFLQDVHDVPDPSWLASVKVFPLDLILIIACSIFSHYCIELPLIRYGRRFRAERS